VIVSESIGELVLLFFDVADISRPLYKLNLPASFLGGMVAESIDRIFCIVFDFFSSWTAWPVEVGSICLLIAWEFMLTSSCF